MSDAVAVGEKIHIITRRMFPEDVRRHFVGVVVAASAHGIRVEGYVFVFNSGDNEYLRRTPQRVRVFSVSDGNIINILPPDVEIDDLQYQIVNGRLSVTDRKNYALDINEFGPTA